MTLVFSCEEFAKPACYHVKIVNNSLGICV